MCRDGLIAHTVRPKTIVTRPGAGDQCVRPKNHEKPPPSLILIIMTCHVAVPSLTTSATIRRQSTLSYEALLSLVCWAHVILSRCTQTIRILQSLAPVALFPFIIPVKHYLYQAIEQLP